jgi:hypothetical protein
MCHSMPVLWHIHHQAILRLFALPWRLSAQEGRDCLMVTGHTQSQANTCTQAHTAGAPPPGPCWPSGDGAHKTDTHTCTDRSPYPCVLCMCGQCYACFYPVFVHTWPCSYTRGAPPPVPTLPCRQPLSQAQGNCATCVLSRNGVWSGPRTGCFWRPRHTPFLHSTHRSISNYHPNTTAPKNNNSQPSHRLTRAPACHW